MSDDRSFYTELSVGAGVISVPMCVEHVAQLAFAQLLKRGANLVRKRSKLVIDYQNPIGSD